MCIEDIKIMAQSSGPFSDVAITNSDGQLLSPSAQRIGIIFCPHNTDSYWVTTDAAAVVGRGIRIAVGGAPVILDVFHHGDFCRRGWRAITEAGAATVAVGELLLNVDLSRAAKYGEA